MEELNFERDFGSVKQLDEQVEKLKAFSQSLKGKELQLKKKELELREKELQLKLYRKNLLVAIKEQLSNAYAYEESVKVLERYRDILQFIAQDIKDELDDIMG
jgi:hypothetical protein